MLSCLLEEWIVAAAVAVDDDDAVAAAAAAVAVAAAVSVVCDIEANFAFYLIKFSFVATPIVLEASCLLQAWLALAVEWRRPLDDAARALARVVQSTSCAVSLFYSIQHSWREKFLDE